MHKLAKLSAQERQRIIDDFVDDVFAGTDPDAPAASIARGMRQLPAELPDDPAPEQVNAWVELAELVARDDFRQRARSMVLAGQSAAQAQAQAASQADQDAGQVDYQAVAEHAREAAAQGIAPGCRRPGQSWTASSRPAPLPRSGPACSSSSIRSPTAGWRGTGSSWPSSTASRCRPRWCPAWSG